MNLLSSTYNYFFRENENYSYQEKIDVTIESDDESLDKSLDQTLDKSLQTSKIICKDIGIQTYFNDNQIQVRNILLCGTLILGFGTLVEYYKK